jgi:uroporphyrinogen III methyltransferase/synthase
MSDAGLTKKPGKVYFVGAGPGDPGLITLRGVECLQRADVVLYDYLVNARLLDHVRADAARICLGEGGGRAFSQEQINARLVELAREGKAVVRLKGGDPMVFARIAEETGRLTAWGIPFEIVPGVTAGLAASSCAGIPITHRDFASAVALVTGQEKRGKAGPPMDYAALAKFPGTLVFYMGSATAQDWAATLIAAGKPAGTPVAIVRRCSFPDQTTVRCSLGELAAQLAPCDDAAPPAVIIVGEAAAPQQSLSWFERRPLFGKKVMVTRPRQQAGALASRFTELGADVLLQPAIRIAEPPDWAPVDRALDRLGEFDWLVFSSANGVEYFLERLLATGRDLRVLAGLQLAAIGPGTASELKRRRLTTDLQAEEYCAESLAALLARDAAGKRVLLARASRGREVLAEQLRGAGGYVEQIVVYSSIDTTVPDGHIAALLRDGRVDWTTVTSSAIARSLAAMFGANLRKSRLASISPITSATMRELGYEPAAEASRYTMEGLVEAMVRSHR